LVHGNGSHLIKGPLGTNGLKEGAAGTAGDQLHWTTDEQWEQLENNHHEDWTTDMSRRNGLLYFVRPFGKNSLKEGAM
jgi:hypothetical protein